jgi:putative spermidine/putrescine transport system permease protein
MIELHPGTRVIDLLNRRALYCGCALTLAFLIAPLVAIMPLSFNSGSFLTYPLAGLSLRWYSNLVTGGDWLSAVGNSLWVATAVAVLATPLGTLAALGLARLPRPVKPLVMTVLLAPMFVPVIIVAVATYLVYAPLGLADTYSGLILAHTTLAAPFAVVLINAALQGVDPSVLRAAASLGAPPPTVMLRVLLPLIAPGVVAAAVVSFATSFDEIVVALFLAGTEHKTLPMKMFEGARDEISPAITAASTVLVMMSLLFLGVVEAVRRRRENNITIRSGGK